MVSDVRLRQMYGFIYSGMPTSSLAYTYCSQQYMHTYKTGHHISNEPTPSMYVYAQITHARSRAAV